MVCIEENGTRMVLSSHFSELNLEVICPLARKIAVCKLTYSPQLLSWRITLSASNQQAQQPSFLVTGLSRPGNVSHKLQALRRLQRKMDGRMLIRKVELNSHCLQLIILMYFAM